LPNLGAKSANFKGMFVKNINHREADCPPLAPALHGKDIIGKCVHGKDINGKCVHGKDIIGQCVLTNAVK
jgi:hypothetical protein